MLFDFLMFEVLKNDLSSLIWLQPNRPDEVARIKKCGGKFVYSNGLRVEGILSMTRAIGNIYLLSL